MANAEELLDRWLAAFNNGQMESFEAFMSPTAMIEEVGTHQTFGQKEVTHAAQVWKQAFPDFVGAIVNKVASGNQVVGEIVWTGTNTGSFNGMPPSGKDVRVCGIAVLTEDRGRAEFLRLYVDVAGLLEQIGSAPMLTSPPATVTA
ncbi:MAG: hypothetical protein JW395_0777 [Nitrospira sp.]|nr:hypothetical protein [Nitrospira sp.]